MNSPARQIYEFGQFRLDGAERLLVREGTVVPLTPKAFDTLLLLVENSGHVLNRDELLEAVWRDSFVEENTLTRNIAALRKALGERLNGTPYIETIPKTGYRFVAQVRELGHENGAVWVEKRTRERVVIEAQVVDAEAKEDDARNLFALQDAALAGMTEVLFPEMAASVRALPARRQTASPEAYEAYVKGRFLWNQRTGEGLHQSTLLFEQAVAKDPRYAQAYIGLAEAYAFDGVRWRQAEAMARKALELDHEMGAAHAAIGFVRMFWEWEWKAAGEEFRAAISLAPSYATGHQWYAIYLAVTGQALEAQEEIRQALALDPFSLPINADQA